MSSAMRHSSSTIRTLGHAAITLTSPSQIHSAIIESPPMRNQGYYFNKSKLFRNRSALRSALQEGGPFWASFGWCPAAPFLEDELPGFLKQPARYFRLIAKVGSGGKGIYSPAGNIMISPLI